MAKKKITDLQLIAAVTDDLNLPGDNGIQSYRATALQLKNYVLAPGNVGTTEIANEAVTLQKLANSLLATLIPIGAALPYTGDTAPSSSFIIPQGQELNRTTYAEYFALVGTRFGEGDGSTTFNAPDWRGKYLRNLISIPAVAGSGSASSNNATFTGHGLKTGMRVRITAGALTGLTIDTMYYAIKVDANTLAFATTPANAYAGTKITISGTNTATVSQAEDTGSGNRYAMAQGGATSGIGSNHSDAGQKITGSLQVFAYLTPTDGAFNRESTSGSSSNPSGSGRSSNVVSFDSSRVARAGLETRVNDTYVNHIIRVL